MRAFGRSLLVALALPASVAAAMESGSVTAPPRPTEPPPLLVTPTPTPADGTAEPSATPTPEPSRGAEEGGGQAGLDVTPGVATPTPADGLRGEIFERAPQGQYDAIEPGMEPIDPIATVETTAGMLRALDKMTGDVTDIDMGVREQRQVYRLVVELGACRAPEDGSGAGTMGFVKIWDTKGEAPELVFSGWMFADSPALSAMDHPRYDVWLVTCR